VIANTELGVIGLSVCYDLRFPELYRALTFAGATLICIPSAFTFPTGAAHWEPLLRARAIENQAWIVAPNQFGRTPRGSLDYGNSMIVDPWGTVVARAGYREGVVVADIDLGHAERLRKTLPALAHRRGDLFTF
jgi:predicted amidohydrolase